MQDENRTGGFIKQDVSFPNPNHMAKILKFAGVSVGTVISLIILVIIGAEVYLETGQGRKMIRNQINAAIPGKVEWKRAAISLFTGRISLDNAVVKGQDGRSIITADRATADIGLSGLLRQEIVIENARFQNPRVNLATDREGNLNIVQAFWSRSPLGEPESESTFPSAILIERVEVMDGTLQYQMDSGSPGQPSWTFAFRHVGGTLKDSDIYNTSGQLVITAGSGSIDIEGIHTPVRRLSFDANLHKNGNVDPLTIRFESDGSVISLAGSMARIFENPEMNFDVAFNGDLASVREMLKLETAISGPVELTAKATGGMENPAITLAANYGGGDLPGMRVNAADLTARMEDQRVMIGKLTIETAPGRLTADGIIDLKTAFGRGGLFGGSFDVNAISYDLAVRTEEFALDKLPWTGDRLAGKIGGNFRLSGKGVISEKMTANAAINVSGEKIAVKEVLAPTHLTLSGNADMAAGNINLHPLAAETGGAVLKITGNYRLPEDMMDLGINFDAPNLAPIAGPLNLPVASGPAHLTAMIKGPVMQPEITAELNLKNGGYEKIKIGDLSLDARLAESGRLAVKSLKIDNKGSVIRAGGTIDVFEGGITRFKAKLPVDLTASLKVIDIGNFTPAAKGKLNGRMRLTGTIMDPRAEVSLNGSGLTVLQRSLGSLTASATLVDGSIRIAPLTLLNGKSAMNLTGSALLFKPDTFALREAPPIDLKLTGKSIRLGDFDKSLSGQLSINADIGGTLYSPQGKILLDGRRIDLGVQKFESIHISSRLENRRIYFEPATFEVTPGARVKAAGWASTDKEYDIRITSDPIPLSGLGSLGKTGIGGALSLDLSGAGTFPRPEMRGALRMSGITLDGKPVHDLNLDMALKDRMARVNGNAGFPLNAWYNLDTGEFATNADFSGTDLGLYFQLAGFRGISGQVTGNLRASGNVSAPENARAHLDIAELTIRKKETQLVRTVGLKADLENRRFAISPSRISLLRDGYVDARGNGNISGDLDIQLNGKIPLKAITPFAPSIQNPAGNIGVEAAVRGSVKNPRIDAEASFEKVGMIIPVLGQKLHDLNGNIRVTETALKISNVTGGIDTGRFIINGGFDLRNMLPVYARLRLTAYTLPVQVPDMLSMKLNSDLVLEGVPGDSTLSGTITILDGLYSRDVNLSLVGAVRGKLGEIGKREREVAPQKTMPSIPPTDLPFLKNLKFDVAIAYRNPIVVDNNLALLQVKPELGIQGPLTQPKLNGRAEIPQGGTVTYRDTSFEVRKGIIDFVNPYRIEPTINIEADARVREWTITLAITGMPQNLKFQLTSNPQETDADILSLLLVGKTTAELNQDTGAGAQGPEQMLARVLGEKVARDVKATTGLDVQIQYEQDTAGGPTTITPRNETEEGPGAQTGKVPGVTPGRLPSPTVPGGSTPGTVAPREETVQITVGKELSRRLSVIYGIERKSGEIVQQNTAVYKLLENLSVNAYQDTAGTFGGELRFRVEFR